MFFCKCPDGMCSDWATLWTQKTRLPSQPRWRGAIVQRSVKCVTSYRCDRRQRHVLRYRDPELVSLSDVPDGFKCSDRSHTDEQTCFILLRDMTALHLQWRSLLWCNCDGSRCKWAVHFEFGWANNQILAGSLYEALVKRVGKLSYDWRFKFQIQHRRRLMSQRRSFHLCLLTCLPTKNTIFILFFLISRLKSH